jgi:hypothetical protein
LIDYPYMDTPANGGEVSPQQRRLRVLPRILSTAIFFAAVEGLIFHSGLYSSIIEPASTAGFSEYRLRNEILRPKSGGKQVLVAGDSRMAFYPRIADPMTRQTCCIFGTISVPGTSPRCWYYQLRYVDPTARRYAAVVIPSDDYDDQEQWPDARESDLPYLLPRLELRDLIEFPRSFLDRKLQWVAFRGVLLKGYGYRTDFQDFLTHPAERLEKVRVAKEGSAGWFYNYELAEDRVTVEQRQSIEESFLRDRPVDTGRGTAYFRYWYGRILDHYRSTETKIIFFRLPRGPVPPPSHPPKRDGAIRQLASKLNVIVFDEHLFDELERPELFYDDMHMNREGATRFTRMLAAEIARVLTPPTS